MWDTILFDLDGTLTDSAPGITRAVAHALAHFGIRAEPGELLKFVGPPLTESLPGYCAFTPDQTDEAVRVFRAYYNEKGWLENSPYPGVEDLLEALRDAGKRLLVATSKPENQAVRILEHFGLARYFDVIRGGAETGNETRKADVIRLALGGAGRASAVMVGDRKHDVEGAHETGLPCVGVLYGYGGRAELEAAGADRIASDMAELKELLLETGTQRPCPA